MRDGDDDAAVQQHQRGNSIVFEELDLKLKETGTLSSVLTDRRRLLRR